MAEHWGPPQFKQLDQASGDLRFENATPSGIDWATQDIWHLELPSGDVTKLPGSLPVRITTQATNLRLVPTDSLSADQLDQILFSDGPLPVFDHARPFWPSHHSDNLQRKERIPAEIFLIIDPLVSLSTAIASGNWVWSLAAAFIILILCLVIPRGFCGYICPPGTLIDLFDRFVGQRVQRFRAPETGWWVHIKYYLLGAVLFTSAFGVLTSGHVSAIPIITRGFLFIGEPLQTAITRGTHLIPPMNSGHILSIILFIAVLGLGLLRPRFWCKYVCPSGALFSLGNLFRATDRKVESSCIHCNKCVTICPFDAIKPDFTTRGTDCTQCQTCAGVCPTHSIKFVERWNNVALKSVNEPANHETAIGRRGFLSWAIGSSVAAIAATSYTSVNRITGANLDDPNSFSLSPKSQAILSTGFSQKILLYGNRSPVCLGLRHSKQDSLVKATSLAKSRLSRARST
jgi:ferredoxin